MNQKVFKFQTLAYLFILTVLSPISLLALSSNIDKNAAMNAHEISWLEHKSKEILHHIAGDDVVAYFGFNPQLEIYASPIPEVAIYETSLIRISTAMLSQIRNEDEMAFILSHEIAHSILGHRSYTEAHMKSSGRHIESDADQQALKLMASAGYNLSAPYRLLVRIAAYEYEGSGLTVADLHPALIERQNHLRGYATTTL